MSVSQHSFHNNASSCDGKEIHKVGNGEGEMIKASRGEHFQLRGVAVSI